MSDPDVELALENVNRPRFYLKAPWSDEWTEVTKKEWVKAERREGFSPRGIRADDPRYLTTCATAGFTGLSGISGRVEY